MSKNRIVYGKIHLIFLLPSISSYYRGNANDDVTDIYAVIPPTLCAHNHTII
jgi:hypothetical protein